MVDNPDPYDRDCPSRQVLDRVGDKWTVLVLGALESGPLRYSEIEARIPGLTQKMLTQTVRALERDGLVLRTVYPEVPPHVDYRLTDLGLTLLAPLATLRQWAVANINDVLVARARFDETRQGNLLAAAQR